MNKKFAIAIVGFLFLFNIIAWQEVFDLNKAKNFKVDFLDVGQGDSAFIETPEGNQIVIDGGPSSAVLEKIAQRVPFWDKDLDLVILSHPEKDHMQGLLDILKIYKADYILWSGVVKENPEYLAWINILEQQKKMGAKILIAKSGQEILAGGAVIDVLFPFDSLEGQKIKNTSNNTAVVPRIIYGNKSFLFTADIDMAGERKIINSGQDLLSDVLKVAHHGSKYSTSDEILQAVKPKFAIIEVGKNTYGHPTPETLQKLDKFGIKTLRTDQNGDITILTNGNNINLLVQK